MRFVHWNWFGWSPIREITVVALAVPVLVTVYVASTVEQYPTWVSGKYVAPVGDTVMLGSVVYQETAMRRTEEQVTSFKQTVDSIKKAKRDANIINGVGFGLALGSCMPSLYLTRRRYNDLREDLE